VVSDFRREYNMTPDELAGLGLPEFTWLLEGLSDRSRFRVAWSNAPKHVHDPKAIAAITAAARR
jgi:hypothetical protein